MKLTSNRHITNTSIIVLMIILIFTYIIIFFVIDKNEYLAKNFNNCVKHCVKPCCTYITQFSRGNNYTLKHYNHYDCIFTIWELSHILFYIFIGYYYNIYYVLGIGTIFELYEYHMYNCENYLDIMYDMIGGFVGIGLRNYNYN